MPRAAPLALSRLFMSIHSQRNQSGPSFLHEWTTSASSSAPCCPLTSLGPHAGPLQLLACGQRPSAHPAAQPSAPLPLQVHALALQLLPQPLVLLLQPHHFGLYLRLVLLEVGHAHQLRRQGLDLGRGFGGGRTARACSMALRHRHVIVMPLTLRLQGQGKGLGCTLEFEV